MKQINKWLFVAILLSITAGFTSCGSDDNDEDNSVIIQKEKDRYDDFVTPELEDVLKTKLGMTIHRGINPPNVQGYFRMETNCVKSTIKNDYLVGKLINNLKINLFDQKGLEISMTGFEVATNTNNFKASHEALGTFISGEGDNFSIFFNEEVVALAAHYTNFCVLSGTLDRDAKGNVIGIKNFEYSLLMRNNNGFITLMPNNEGRLFRDDYTPIISETEYNTIVGGPEQKNVEKNTDVSISMASLRIN